VLLTAGRYITEGDLQVFKDRCERNAPMEGATQWELQMDKDFSTFNYAAYRRILPVQITTSLPVLRCQLMVTCRCDGKAASAADAADQVTLASTKTLISLHCACRAAKRSTRV
jgi:hypothetical protein